MLSQSDNTSQHCEQYHQKANKGICTATQGIQFYTNVELITRHTHLNRNFWCTRFSCIDNLYQLTCFENTYSYFLRSMLQSSLLEIKVYFHINTFKPLGFN